MATSSKAKKKTVRSASGLKRARQDVKLNAANTALRSKFRTVIKNVQKAVAGRRQGKGDRTLQDRTAGDRLDRRQGSVPEEQGGTPQEPSGGEGQGAGDGYYLIAFPAKRARIASPFCLGRI
jgi:ribosomal protein S20